MRRAIATVFVCALLLLAGCNGMGGSETTTGGTENGTDAGTASNATSGGANGSAADVNFSFREVGDGEVLVVHMGGGSITNETTSEVVVSVDGQNVTWVSDDAEASAQEYPLSIGNTLTVNATAGDTIEVVWVGQDGRTQTLATHEVEASATTTAANATNGTTAAASATATTTATTEA